MTARTSARQATKDETREALVTAGALEFAEKGLDAPSLDAICARAGFTRGAFYVHFRDRDDLLVAVVERVLGTFQDTILASADAPGDLAETVGRFVAAVAVRAPAVGGAGKWRFRHTLAACARLPALRRRYLELQEGAILRVAGAAAAGQRAGRVRRDVPARTMAEVLVLLTLGISAAIELQMPFDLAGGAAGLDKLLSPAAASRARPPPASKRRRP